MSSGRGSSPSAGEQPFQVVRREDGVTLVLDVAVTRDLARSYEAMARCRAHLAAAHGARLVDDRGNALDERSLAAIGAQLEAVRQTLAGHGIEHRQPARAAPVFMSAAREKSKPCAKSIERHNRLYYVEDAPEVTDAEYDALFRELQALEARASRAAHAGLADAARRRRAAAAVRRGRAPRADAVAQQRVRRGGGARPSTGACARRSASTPVEYAVRAQVRRPRDQPALPRRRVRPGRDARRRRDRRGRDRRTCAPCASIPLRLPDEAASAARSARRSLMIARDFEALNERQRERGAEGVRQSAQRRGGRAAPARSRITAQRPLTFFAYGIGVVARADAAGTHRDAARPARRARLSGLRRSATWSHGVEGLLDVLRAASARMRAQLPYDDRRRRLQGQPPRLQQRARLRLARAALGASPTSFRPRR